MALRSSYRDEISLVHHLVEILESRLAGRDEKRVVNKSPIDVCHLGVVGPWDPNTERQDLDELDEADEDLRSAEVVPSTNTSLAEEAEISAEVDDEEKDEQEEALTENRSSVRRPPSSLGFEILVQPDEDGLIELDIKATFAIYTPHLPMYGEQLSVVGGLDKLNQSTVEGEEEIGTLAEVWERHEINGGHIELAFNPDVEQIKADDRGQLKQILDQVLSSEYARTDACPDYGSSRKPTVERSNLLTHEAYGALLSNIKQSFPPQIYPQIIPRLDIRIIPWGRDSYRICCYLRNDTPQDTEQRFRDQYNILADVRLIAAITKGLIRPIEILPVPQDYQYDRRVWVVGHNTSAFLGEDNHIYTEALAKYEQPRRVATTEPGARFEDVISDPMGTLRNIHAEMTSYREDWEARIINENRLELEGEALEACKHDLQHFSDEETQFCAGIAALNSDERLLKAFIGMNQVFQKITAGRYDRWRLFQIVFIITQLPALVAREGIREGEWPAGNQRKWGDVLNTADVLWFPTGGGKTEAYLGLISCAALYDRLRGKDFGITAWLRFPLRMLSVQQLQRATKVIWETERVRQDILGESARNSDPISLGYFVGKTSTPNRLETEDFERLEREKDRLLMVATCPDCGGPLEVQLDESCYRIRHICQNCHQEIPLYISDSEIYRFLPTLLIGTIDKIATIGYQTKFALLWGGATWRCPIHGYGTGPKCVKDCPTDKKKPEQVRTQIEPYDAAPSLHIQDELHLLQEELGAFAGHYETLLHYCEENLGGQPPKIVAATATIEGFEHQVQHIYGVKTARRIPERGYDRLGSFYIKPLLDPDTRDVQTARIYVGFRPANLQASDAASLCTTIVLEEIKRLYEHPMDATDWFVDARTETEIRALLLFYTTTLTYVGTLPGGTRIRDSLEREASRIRPGEVRDLQIEYHSSGSSMGELADLIDRLEKPPEWSDEEFIDALVATDIISHGVDVERLNLMFMDSVPEEIARYIQASSRSGRQHVGLVVGTLPSYSLRATSIYHRYKEFHDHMERLVSPIPVNRFAKYAIDRTATGILTGLIFGYFNSIVPEYLLFRYAAENFLRANRAIVSDAAERSYALGDEVYAAGLEYSLSERLDEQIDRFIYNVANSDEKWLTDAIKPKPMTSLRDVERGVQFLPDEDVDMNLIMYMRMRNKKEK